tara:strand:+ start:135 stop:299 length:165 start_codon:yes stop_codon:yes gene_type:complete
MTYPQFLLAAAFAFALIGCVAGDNERENRNNLVKSRVEANKENSAQEPDIPPLP